MKPIKNFDTIREASDGFEVLPVGGYVCKILECVEKENKSGRGSHLEISFDICEGDYREWFAQDYRGQGGKDPYWRGVIRQNIPNEDSDKYEMQCRFFKRFVSAVENSNPMYTWNWDEESLKGKQIGVVFGEVERESARGIRYMVTQPDSVCKVEAVRDGSYRTPKPRMLYNPAPAAAPGSLSQGLSELSGNDSDLPF